MTIGDVTLVARRVDDASKDLLRSIADQVKSTLTSGVVFLAGPTADGKVAMVASVTGNVTARLKAGQLVKELAPIVGGGGGGRPDFAEAGGKDPAQIDAMLAAAPEVVQTPAGGVIGEPMNRPSGNSVRYLFALLDPAGCRAAAPGVRADLLMA